MKSTKIIIGEYYRLKSNPTYSYFQAIEVLKPKQGINKHNYIIVKGSLVLTKDCNVGIIKYFRPCDLTRIENGKAE